MNRTEEQRERDELLKMVLGALDGLVDGPRKLVAAELIVQGIMSPSEKAGIKLMLRAREIVRR